MGLKMMLVKGAGSQASLAPAHIAPQCGSKGVSQRGRKMPLGVGFGSQIKRILKKPHETGKSCGVVSGVRAGCGEITADETYIGSLS
jgi:hypothetical protein